jgi:hypothetical protein
MGPNGTRKRLSKSASLSLRRKSVAGPKSVSRAPDRGSFVGAGNDP